MRLAFFVGIEAGGMSELEIELGVETDEAGNGVAVPSNPGLKPGVGV